MALDERYAGIGTTCYAFTVGVAAGGSISTGGTLYFSFQLQNRAGLNQPYVTTAVTYTAAQEITITIPAPPAGFDVFYFVISAGTTNDPSTHVNIARVPYYTFGTGINPQSVPQTFPYVLTLSQDAHIVLAPSVAAESNLPTASTGRLDGQTRYITGESRWLQYWADSTLAASSTVSPVDVGCWVQRASPNSNITNTLASGGSDQNLTVLTANQVTLPPAYPVTPFTKVLPDWQLYFWLVNNQTYNFPAGSQFGIDVIYNNEVSPSLMSGLLYIEFVGFVNVSTGTIRTTVTSTGVEFSNLGSYVPWSNDSSTPFITEDDLLPGEAIAIGVKPFFAEGDFPNNSLQNGDTFTFLPSIRQQGGDYNPLGMFLRQASGYGGAVAVTGGRYRVLPNGGALSFDVASGQAVVGDYSFPIQPQRTFFGLTANTAGQKIIINGSAAVYAALSSYVPNTTTEWIRALVGTVAGEGQATTFSSAIAVAAAGGLSIVVGYPTGIRSTYPDYTAGTTCPLSVYSVNFYLQRSDTSEIRKFSGFLVVNGASQTFSITDWSTGTVVSGLPTIASNFGLFAPGSTVPTAITGGNFTATNYAVAWSFQYNGSQITTLNHEDSSCIPEWEGTFAPPSITINSVTTLTPGSSAYVNNSGTGTNAILEIGIPAGLSAYSQTTASFVQPAVGSTVTVSLLNSQWLAVGQNIFIETGGDYIVSSLPSSTTATLTNSGATINAAPATSIPTSSTVASSGATGQTGQGAYTQTTASFVQPAVNAAVTVTMQSTAWLAVDAYVSIYSGGNYQVASIVDGMNATLTNLGSQGSASVGATIASGQDVTASGTQGVPGQGAYTVTASSFTQPDLGSNVSVNVGSTVWMVAGQTLYVETAGYYTVASITSSTVVVLTNNGATANATPGTTITTGQGVVSSGSTGAMGNTGATGQSAYTTTTASFAQPNIGSNVTVYLTNSSWMQVGQSVQVGAGGVYTVYSISSPTQISVTNTGQSGNVSSGTAVASGSSVTCAGIQGISGSVSAASSLLLTEQSSAPGTSSSQVGVYASAGGNLTVQDPASGSSHQVAVLDKPQTWSKRQAQTVVTLTISSGVVTADLSQGNLFILTLTANVTNFTCTNVAVGTYMFKIINGSTSYTVAFDTSIFKAGSGSLTISTTASSSNVLSCASFDGTTLDSVMNPGV